MGILSQLFEDETDDVTFTNPDGSFYVDDEVVINFSYGDLIAGSLSRATHQAMIDGMYPETKNILTREGRPRVNQPGTIDVTKTLEIQYDYRKLIIQDQLKDIRFNPTVNDVLDGGIKPGSKVVIEMVPEVNELNSNTRFDLVRTRLERSKDSIPKSLVFDKFSVMNITEPDEARYQIHETFGADFINSFGRRPRIMIISGNVLNGKLDVQIGGTTRSMDWKNAFQRFYDDFFSLHACQKRGLKTRLYAQDTIWDGYALNMVANTTAMDQSISQVTISFVIADRYYHRENDKQIPGYVDENGFVITGGITPEDFMPKERIEFYFRGDPQNILTKRLSDLRKEKFDILVKIGQADNSGQNANTNTTFLASLKDTMEGSQSLEDKFDVIAGFKIHFGLIGSTNIHLDLLSLEKEESQLFNDIEAYKDEAGIPTSAEESESEIPPPSSGGSEFDALADELAAKLIELEFKRIKDLESSVRIRKKGLVHRLKVLNNLAVKYDALSDEEERLDETLGFKTYREELRVLELEAGQDLQNTA